MAGCCIQRVNFWLAARSALDILAILVAFTRSKPLGQFMQAEQFIPVGFGYSLGIQVLPILFRMLRRESNIRLP